MNDDRNLERKIASTYEEIAPPREPRGLLDDILLTTSHTRQRPSWLALIKESPMRISSSIAVGSPTARVAAIMVATLLLAIMVAGAGVAGSRLLAADGPIVVDKSGNGTVETITAAVAIAADGDTIVVKPGTYDESVTITKDITIRGDDDPALVVIELSAELPPGAIDDVPGLPFAFRFEGAAAVLENLTLRGEAARIDIAGGSPRLSRLHLDGIGRVYGVDPGNTVPTGVDVEADARVFIERCPWEAARPPASRGMSSTAAAPASTSRMVAGGSLTAGRWPRFETIASSALPAGSSRAATRPSRSPTTASKMLAAQPSV